jgi:hypothetical protein
MWSSKLVAEKTTSFAVSATRRTLERRLLGHAMRVLRPFAGNLAGVGIAVPALCDTDDSRVLACTPLPGLVGTHLPRLLAEETGVPTVLEEDVRALALGQRWFGQARGVDEFVALQIGSGIGAAIMSGGRLLRGESGTSEVGHTCVDINGARCGCGLTGCSPPRTGCARRPCVAVSAPSTATPAGSPPAPPRETRPRTSCCADTPTTSRSVSPTWSTCCPYHCSSCTVRWSMAGRSFAT